MLKGELKGYKSKESAPLRSTCTAIRIAIYNNKNNYFIRYFQILLLRLKRFSFGIFCYPALTTFLKVVKARSCQEYYWP